MSAQINQIREVRAGVSEYDAGGAISSQGVAASSHPLSPVSFTIPTPPSVNEMFKNTKSGRAKTEKYRDWKMSAKGSLKRQQLPHVPGHVFVAIGVERANSAADIDNRQKAILDMLSEKTGVGIISDDNMVTALLSVWLPYANGLTHVQVYPIGPIRADLHVAPDGATASWIIAPPPQMEATNGY